MASAAAAAAAAAPQVPAGVDGSGGDVVAVEDDAADDDEPLTVNEEFALRLLRTALDPVAVLRPGSAAAATAGAAVAAHKGAAAAAAAPGTVAMDTAAGPTATAKAAPVTAAEALAARADALQHLWDIAAVPSAAALLHRNGVLAVLQRVLSAPVPPGVALSAAAATPQVPGAAAAAAMAVAAAPPAAAPPAALIARVLECACGVLANALSVCPAAGLAVAHDAAGAAAAAAAGAPRRATLCDAVIALLFSQSDVSVLAEACRVLHTALCAEYSDSYAAPFAASQADAALTDDGDVVRGPAMPRSLHALQWQCRSGWLAALDGDGGGDAVALRLLELYANALHAPLWERVSCVAEDVWAFDSARGAIRQRWLRGGLLLRVMEAVCDVHTHARFPAPAPLRIGSGSAAVAAAAAVSAGAPAAVAAPPGIGHYSDAHVRGLEASLRLLESMTRSLRALTGEWMSGAQLQAVFGSPLARRSLLEALLVRGGNAPRVQVAVAQLLPNVLHLLLPALPAGAAPAPAKAAGVAAAAGAGGAAVAPKAPAAAAPAAAAVDSDYSARETVRAPAIATIVALYNADRIDPALTLYLVHALMAPVLQPHLSVAAGAGATALALSASDAAVVRVVLDASADLIGECVPHAIRDAVREAQADAAAADGANVAAPRPLSDVDAGFCALWHAFLMAHGAALAGAYRMGLVDQTLARLRALRR